MGGLGALGESLGVQGASWMHLGCILGASEGVSRPSLGVLEGSWRHLGAMLGRLGGSWEGLGGVLDAFWEVFWASWRELFETPCFLHALATFF